MSTAVTSWMGVVLAASVSVACGAAAQERIMVLDGGTLIDGTGRGPLANAVVVVEGTRIKAVGARGQVSYPPSATVIRLDGRPSCRVSSTATCTCATTTCRCSCPTA